MDLLDEEDLFLNTNNSCLLDADQDALLLSGQKLETHNSPIITTPESPLSIHTAQLDSQCSVIDGTLNCSSNTVPANNVSISMINENSNASNASTSTSTYNTNTINNNCDNNNSTNNIVTKDDLNSLNKTISRYVIEVLYNNLRKRIGV